MTSETSNRSTRTRADTLNLGERIGSVRWFERACTAIPGGVHSPVRAFKSVAGLPVYFAATDGARVTDVDGNRYIDFCMSWGPLILGHAHPEVVEVVRYAATLGLSYGACHPAEVELAERVVAAFDGFDRCRLVSSGTEAVMTALRIARGATGRPLIVKFEGGYHGHSDGLLVKAGSGLITGAEADSEPTSAGIPGGVAATTLVLPFGDLDAVRQLFAQHGDQVAALVIEPVPANNGLLPQGRAYLEGLRAITSEHGALLIFDEVITGFRTRYGGYGHGQGVQPDLVTLGKVIGGGMPIGAIVGPERYMDLLAPVGPVYQAGTLSGNPVSVAAGTTTLELLEDGDAYARLETLGAHLEQRIAGSGRSWPQVRRVGSICWLYFDDGPLPTTADGIAEVHVRRFNEMHGTLLERGLYLPPSAYEVLFLSTAHTVEDIDELIDTVLACCDAIDKAG